MKILSKISGLALLSIMLGLTSCRKFNAVAPLTSVNEVTVEGLQPNYTFLLGSNFQIAPGLAFTQDKSGDTARYKYQWYTLNLGLYDFDGNYKVLLDSTKNLTSKVGLAPGSYLLYYVVKDTVTGISWQQYTNLKVTTPYYEGWLVLSDAGAAPRLDMISYNDAGTGVVIDDVLGKLGSALVLSGEAKNVVCMTGDYNYSIVITTTGNGTNRVDPENFGWTPTDDIRYAMLDNTIAPDFYADPVVQSDTYYLQQTLNSLYSKGNVYRTSNGTYGLPVNRVQGEAGNFYASRWFAGMGGAAYLYDTVKRRFTYNNIQSNGYCTTLPVYGSPGASLFDFNNTGMDLVWMGFSMYNGATVYAILKEPGLEKYHLALIDLNGQSQTYYANMTATDIGSATHFGISADYGYVFYSVGGKLYEYDLGLKTSKLMKDYGSNVISDINGGVPLADQYGMVPLKRKLVVSTYDPAGAAGANGKLDIFTIPPVNGNLVLGESYTGFGLIRSIAYRQRS